MAQWPLSDSSNSWQAGANEADSGQITVTGGAANTKGAWSELVASCGQTDMIFLSVRIASPASSDTAVLIDIGVGPAGSETVVVPNIDMGGRNGIFHVPLPLSVPQGTRIAARL